MQEHFVSRDIVVRLALSLGVGRLIGLECAWSRKDLGADNPIRRWYRKHETENPYKVASQVYAGVLSQPQLFQEGNHRTGSARPLLFY